MKQWALESVVEDHSYNSVSYSNCHDNFIKWVKSMFKNKIDVIDIGGGNGRIMIELYRYVNQYFNFELNKKNIEVGVEYFKNKENIHFIEFDIDSQEININADVIYIDSVLTMIDHPFESLLKFQKSADYTFVNRTILGDKTSKGSYQWNGMSEPSTLWEFGIKDMEIFCKENKMELFIVDEVSFYIKNK